MPWSKYLFLFIILGQFITTCATGQQWRQLPGEAVDVACGADGSLWIIGTGRDKTGNYLLKFNKERSIWEISKTGRAVQLTVDSNGRPWIVNKKGKIFRKKGKNWQELPGSATDICANSAVYITGTDERKNGYSIFKWDENDWKWNITDGLGVKIAIGPREMIWTINKRNEIFRKNESNWQQMPGKATDISVGSDGSVWIIGTDKQDHGSSIYKWNELNWSWEKQTGSAVKISADSNGKAYVINSENLILHKIK